MTSPLLIFSPPEAAQPFSRRSCTLGYLWDGFEAFFDLQTDELFLLARALARRWHPVVGSATPSLTMLNGQRQTPPSVLINS
jgi:hypothetical protein